MAREKTVEMELNHSWFARAFVPMADDEEAGYAADSDGHLTDDYERIWQVKLDRVHLLPGVRPQLLGLHDGVVRLSTGDREPVGT